MAGGPGGQEVGRVSIRVVPDTEKFRRELKAQLEAIEKEMKGEVEVNADLDSAAALSRFAAMLAAMRAMAGRGVDVDVRTRTDNNLGVLGRTLARFREALGKTGIGRFNSDLKEFARRQREGNRNLTVNEVRLRALKEAFRRVGDAADNAGDRFQRLGGRLVRARDGLADLADAHREHTRWLRDANPDMSRFTANLASLRAGAREAGGDLRRMSIDRTTSGFQRLGDMAGRAARGFRDMDVNGTNQAMRGLRRVIGGNADESIRLGTALRRLRNGFANTKSFIDRLTPSFLQSGNGANRARNRILLLTAAVLALASPVAALVAGALTALPSLMFAGGAAAAAIALGMDGIKRAAAQLAPQMNALKESVSATFESRLTPQFAQLGALFPKLTIGMNAVANGLSDMSQGFVDTVTSAAGMARIESILTRTGTLFTGITPYVTNLTDSVLTLGDAGARNFDKLQSSMNNWSTKFNQMVQQFNQDSTFDSMFNGLRAVTDGFGNLFNDIYAIGVRAMGQLGPEMGEFLSTLGDVLVTLEPGMTSFADSVLNALAAFGTGVAPEFSTFLTNLGSSLTTLEPILTSLVTNGLSILNTAMTALGPTVQALTPGLQALFNTIANAVNTALPMLGPALEQVATAFSQMMADPAFQGALTNFIVSFADALSQLLPKLVENAPAILELATSFLNLATQALPLVTAAIEVVIAGFGYLVGTVNGFIDIISGAASAVQTAVAAIKAAISGNFSDAGSLLLSAGRALIQGLINGIQGMLGAAVSAARSVASAVANAAKSVLGINSPSKVFHGYGENVSEGLANGIASKEDEAAVAARNLADALSKVFEGSQVKIAVIVGDYKNAIGDIADSTSKATKTIKGQQVPVEKAYGEMDDATKKQKELMQLRADELDFEIKRLDDMADTAANRQRKKQLQEQIDLIKKQQDQMEFDAKKLAYENKFGEAYDSILDEIEQVPPDMESKGLTIMQRLQKGLKDGWAGVQRELRLMGDDFGETFGIENFSEEFDDILEKSKFGSLPQDIAGATGQQFLSDLGIEGNGFIPELIKQGHTYIFNVANMDEANAQKNREQNKEALQYTRR